MNFGNDCIGEDLVEAGEKSSFNYSSTNNILLKNSTSWNGYEQLQQSSEDDRFCYNGFEINHNS